MTLPQDTPVELMAPSEVSTADAVPGQLFKLRVNKPIEVEGRVIVPVGTPAFGQVVSAVDAGAHVFHYDGARAAVYEDAGMKN